MRSLIIIPTYNEFENIQSLIHAIFQRVPSSVEVLVVDDGSPDGTGALVQSMIDREPRVHLLSRPKKMGLGTAYVAGFRWGMERGFDRLIEMDADFSHDPRYLPAMLQTLEKNDFAIGSRYVPGGGTVNWGIGRKILSRGGSLYARTILGAPISDFTGGFNGWHRKVLAAIEIDTLRSGGYSFQIELKYRAFLRGFSFQEFPIVFEDRKVGQSKMNRSIVFEALRRVWGFRMARGKFLTHASTFAAIALTSLLALNSSAWASRPSKAILVDKKTNKLHVTEYKEGRYEIIKSYHATLGQVKGDKEQEADLKTPEGIYTFKTKLTPPGLKPKFGAMAFYMNYPNSFDQIAGRTGFDIMLHATNEPERLKQNYDSEGCIVVKNEEIMELSQHIRIGMTPILVFPELTDQYLAPGQNTKLKTFFDSWIAAWQGKDIDSYINHYHSDFSVTMPMPMDRAAWKTYKQSLNGRYASIEIKVSNIRIYDHPKYAMMTLTQDYSSKLKGGGVGYRSKGTKILFVAEEAGQPKIIAESFSNLSW